MPDRGVTRPEDKPLLSLADPERGFDGDAAHVRLNHEAGDGRADPSSRLLIVAMVLATAAPLWAATFLVTKPWLIIALMTLPGVLLGFYLGPTFAMVQSLVAPAIRATAAALLLMLANVVGLGIGPLAVGALSDLLAPRFGIDSLRFAMLLVPPLLLWAAWHYLAAARTIAADLADDVQSVGGPDGFHGQLGVAFGCTGRGGRQEDGDQRQQSWEWHFHK